MHKRSADRFLKIILLIAACLIGLAIGWVVLSRLSLHHHTQQGSPVNITEKVTLNGSGQWILSRGSSSKKPVLLFIHGGPGLSMMPDAHHWRALEDEFVVVHWDQRGTGKSYRFDQDPLHFNDITQDAVGLAKYLKSRFKQDKIYLLGYSTGSIIGLRLAAQFPEHFAHYIGLCQIIDLVESDTQSTRWAIQEAKSRKNETAIQQLSALPEPPFATMDQLMTQRGWIQEFGGFLAQTDQKGVMRHIQSGIFNSTDIDPADRNNYLTGIMTSIQAMWNQIATVNLSDEIDTLEVPVTFFLGRKDQTVPPGPAEAFLTGVHSTKPTQIIWFEKSAHMPQISEKSKFVTELIKLKQ